MVHHAAVLGLERKLVIWLPGWWKGVDDSWSSEAIDAVDRVFSVSRCSAQLVVIETPCRSEEEEAAEEEEATAAGAPSGEVGLPGVGGSVSSSPTLTAVLGLRGSRASSASGTLSIVVGGRAGQVRTTMVQFSLACTAASRFTLPAMRRFSLQADVLVQSTQ